LPPRQKRLPDALTDDQVRHLLSGIRNPIRKTCLATIYAYGLRLSEVTTLEIGAIDQANQVPRVIGKGNGRNGRSGQLSSSCCG
jgi:site-specific recombinase XerD